MRRAVQRADAELLELLGRRARGLQLLVLARELVVEHARRMAERAARDDGRTILRLEDEVLVVRMRDALLAHDETRAHLHSLRAERERRNDAARVRDAARRDDWYIDGIDDLRHERHRRDLADMAARLRTLSDDGVRAGAHEALRKRDGGDDGDDLRADGLELRHVLTRIARARRDDRHLLLEHNLHNLFHIGAHEHDIDAERLLCPALAFLDLRAQELRRHVAGADDAEAAGVRYRRGELRRADPCHAALENRVFDL